MSGLTRWFLLSMMAFGVVGSAAMLYISHGQRVSQALMTFCSCVVGPAMIYLQRQKFDINKAVKWGMIVGFGTGIPLMLILVALQSYSWGWRGRIHRWAAYESTIAPYAIAAFVLSLVLAFFKNKRVGT